MDLTPYRKLLVFGGSFDPPHRAHVALPRQVREKIGADLILYIPAAISPHKQGATHASAEHRLEMTRLAVEGDPKAIVLPIEIDRGRDQPSYTVETLASLRDQVHEAAELRLLIGADQALTFDRWREADRIIDLADPVVMLRPPDDGRALAEHFDAPATRAFWAERVVEVPTMEISATQIRERLAAGEPVTDLVPEAVAGYIQREGLYRAVPK